MKKRMFLSTILMTLVLLVAVTTATFAWYQATAGSLTANDTDESSISTAVNPYESGAFTVTVEFGATTGTPILTNADGETYYYAGAVTGSEVLDSNPAGAVSAAADFTVTVSYDNTQGLTDDEIADLWNQLGADITVTITDASTGLPDADCGLKFWKTNAHQTSWVNGEDSVSYTFAKAALTFNGASATIGNGTVYYGAKGVDDVAQSASDAYKILATVSE